MTPEEAGPGRGPAGAGGQWESGGGAGPAAARANGSAADGSARPMGRRPRRRPQRVPGGAGAGSRERVRGSGRGGRKGHGIASFLARRSRGAPGREALTPGSQGSTFSQQRCSRPRSGPGIPRLGAVGALSSGPGRGAPRAEPTGVPAAKAASAGVGLQPRPERGAPRAFPEPQDRRFLRAVASVSLPPFP